MKTGLQATASSLIGFVVFGLLLLWPAGTFDYWQAWVLIAIFIGLSTVYTIYLSVTDPDALRRRMHGGPLAETRIVQKFASAGLFVIVPAVMVVSAFDHRFGWPGTSSTRTRCAIAWCHTRGDGGIMKVALRTVASSLGGLVPSNEESNGGIVKTALQAIASGLIGLVVFGLLVFWPAGTFDYWQGWTFIAVFAAATTIPSLYLAVKNPAALRRRMQAGPGAETRVLQKIIISVAFVSLAATIVLSALDFRFGWSSMPAAVSVIGDVLVAVGLGITMLVVIQNGYAAANITVESDQELVTTGFYGLVRHPMYFGNVILMIGIPLALGSYWGLLFVIPGLMVLVVRIVDEEKLLTQELTGYRDYMQRVHYRLMPYVW